METVLDIWLVDVSMKECELIKGGPTCPFGFLRYIFTENSLKNADFFKRLPLHLACVADEI